MKNFKLDYSEKRQVSPQSKSVNLSNFWGAMVFAVSFAVIVLTSGLSQNNEEIMKLQSERDTWILKYDSLYASKLKTEYILMETQKQLLTK